MEVVSCFTNACVYKCEEAMNENLFKEILNDYFKDNYEFLQASKKENFMQLLVTTSILLRILYNLLVDIWKKPVKL